MDLQAPLRGLQPGQVHRADAGLMQPPFPALLAQQPARQAVKFPRLESGPSLPHSQAPLLKL